MVKIKTVLPKEPSHKKEIKRKSKVKKEVNVKKTVKKGIPIGPKRRLEPKLSVPEKPNENKKADSPSNKITASCIEKKNNCSPLNEASSNGNASALNVQEQEYKPDLQNLVFGDIKLPETIAFNEQVEEDSNPDALDTDGSYRAVRRKVTHLRNTVPTSSSKPQKLKFQPRLHKSKFRGGIFWDSMELRKLAIALQKYGFNDIGKVAEYVETKNENQIKDYIRLRVNDVREKCFLALFSEDPNIEDSGKSERGHPKRSCTRAGSKKKLPNKWTSVTAETLASWPHIRKWRKFAFEQMLQCSRNIDYSRTVIQALIKRFYDEEEEPSDSQIINVKAMYKYLLDCVSDEIPAQLPPKESALMSDLLKDLRLLPMLHDFSEEANLLRNYKEATQYRPFEVKDEFRKQFKKGNENTNVNAVKVPEEIFTNLSRHKKLVQSFNPLMIPVWMLQKEQEEIEKSSKNISTCC